MTSRPGRTSALWHNFVNEVVFLENGVKNFKLHGGLNASICACSKVHLSVFVASDRCSVDVDHFIRFQVWTENFCFVFIVRVLFSNLSGIVWTGPKISRRRRPRKRRFKSDFAIYKTSA